jgi:anti-sigma regulatory factor (Ser/Thr protein kinase)
MRAKRRSILLEVACELATNAVLHSASRNPGGTFTVRASIFDDHVRIEVEDNGAAGTNTRTATAGHTAWTSSANSPLTAAGTAAR